MPYIKRPRGSLSTLDLDSNLIDAKRCRLQFGFNRKPLRSVGCQNNAVSQSGHEKLNLTFNANCKTTQADVSFYEKEFNENQTAKATQTDAVFQRIAKIVQNEDKENWQNYFHLRYPRRTLVLVPTKFKSSSLREQIPGQLSTANDGIIPNDRVWENLPFDLQSYCAEMDQKFALHEPLHCVDLAEDMMCTLRNLESRCLPSMESNASAGVIGKVGRARINNWVIQLQHHFRRRHRCLLLAVNFIDRFTHLTQINPIDCQMIAVTAFVIACKVESRDYPDLDELCYLTDNTVYRKNILRCEKQILKALGFWVTNPTGDLFLKRLLMFADCWGDKTLSDLSRYLLDLTLVNPVSIYAKPSKLASAAFMLAGEITGKVEWNARIAAYSGYSASSLLDMVSLMAQLLTGAKSSRYSGAFNKYSSKTVYGGLAKSCDWSKHPVVEKYVPKETSLGAEALEIQVDDESPCF